MKIMIYPYKKGSDSCKNLVEALGARQIRLEGSKYIFKPGKHLVINWGNSEAPEYVGLNRSVGTAANKLKAFDVFKDHDVPHPEWTTDIDVAREWMAPNKIVLCRHKLTGHSGEGIEIFTGEQKAPLYVMYIKKLHEYRFHVFNGEVIDVQQKKRKADAANVNSQIRNLANGWIYARNEIALADEEEANRIAVGAVEALGLDFGAVDLIYNKHYNKYYVLEVNTAPGLTGTTLDNYVKAIKAYAA